MCLLFSLKRNYIFEMVSFFSNIKDNRLFQFSVVTIIILNAILIGATTYKLDPLFLETIHFLDYVITIFFVIEILINVPLFISSVVLIIPIILFGFVINNLSMHKIFNSLIIYIMSIITLILLNTQILDNFIFSEYLPSLLISIFTYFGYVNYGKK